MKNTSSSVQEAIALRRMSLVQAVIELLQRHWPLSAALEQVASTQALPGEGEMPPQWVATRTLEDWYYAFKQGGFEGLKPKPRSDRGKPRRLSTKQQQWILEQVRAFPGVPVKLLYRQWKQADPTLPALSAIYRWLEQNDLALHPKTVATHLCLIIDDHSRLIPYAAYGLAADTQALLGCLKEALRRRGLPRKLYADNGGPFSNNHLKIVCANLGIRLIHSKVGRPWSRGKVERMFRTLQQDFEAGLRLPGQGVGSLEELNGKLARWLQEVYHSRAHEGIGESPQERFARALPLLRLLDPHLDLDRLCYTRIDRVVRKDGTVSIDNDLYEVNLALRGLKVQLELDPWIKHPVLVRCKSQDFGTARKADRHLNSQIGGGEVQP